MSRREPLHSAASIVAALKRQGDPQRAAFSQSFFRTGPGGYGEGDRFLGVTVPAQRRIARRHRALPRSGIARLLESRYHEVRFVGAAILVEQYRTASAEEREQIVAFYLQHRQALDNWDLIDATAPQILGRHLAERGDPRPLFELAASPRLWDRRMAVLASWGFTRRGNTRVTMRLAGRLLGDEHDLMHKAVGWMLREAGKQDEAALLAFLDRHARSMPRTMLRYATERLNESTRSRYIVMRRTSAPQAPARDAGALAPHSRSSPVSRGRTARARPPGQPTGRHKRKGPA